MAIKHLTFTRARLEGLEPGPKVYTVRDIENPALSVRVSPKGEVTYQVRRRPKGSHKVVTVTLGKLSDGIPIKEIRSQAIEIVRIMNSGVNPNAQRKADATANEVQSRTLRNVFDEYKGKLHKYTHKPLAETTVKSYELVMTRDVPDWADQPMINITPVMVLNRYKELTGKGRSAKKMAGLVGSCWTYANDMADTGDGIDAYGPPPIKLLNRQLSGWRKAGSRDRKVSAEDLPAWLAAVRKEGISGAYLEILLLTGLRRRELSGLKWETVDLRRRTFTISKTKNTKPLTLPITDRVMEILRWSKRRFPDATHPLPVKDPRTAIGRVTVETEVKFSPHDLRRTFTTMADLSGAGQYVIKSILNHSSGGDVTGSHYAKFNADDLRDPLQAIENYILGKAKAYRDNVLEVVK